MYRMFRTASLVLLATLAAHALAAPFHVEPSPMEGITARHNAWRARVGAPPLHWSNALAGVAQNWANHLATTGCRLRHSGGDRYGENLYWSRGRQRTAAEVVDSWADERRDYDLRRFRCRSGAVCGHWTQIIWADTQEVGCGVARCPGQQEVWVCNYAPPGNWVGRPPLYR